MARSSASNLPQKMRAFALPVANLGTTNQGKLDLYDGKLRIRRADGTSTVEFDVASRDAVHGAADRICVSPAIRTVARHRFRPGLVIGYIVVNIQRRRPS